jgi:transposase
MGGNSFGVVPSEALAGAERSGGERSEPQRSGAAAKVGADPMVASRPDPEVVAKPKRRTFTAEYKQRILTEAETAAATPGAVGALLGREGLYSSLLAYWRRERAHVILEALTPQTRGPKSKRNSMDEEKQKLRRQNARLAEDLRKAHIIIDVPEKVAALLGHPIPEQDPEEESSWPPSSSWPPMSAHAPLAVHCLRRALPTTGNGARLLPRQ